MKLGKLDRRIGIERKTESRDSYGEPIAVWEQIGTKRWASRFPVSGTERYISDQFISREQTEFQIQWSRDLADLSPMDRIVYPSHGITASPTDPVKFDYYDIIAVHEIGRHEGLRIIAARRTETFEEDFSATVEPVVEAEGFYFGDRYFGARYFGARYFG